MADQDKTFRQYHEPHSNEDTAFMCRHKSGSDVRNLVVCIDGAVNQFGQKNTNVIEFYNLIEKEVGSNQLTWYNSGVGTYARPSWMSYKYYRQVIDHSIDLAIAWNFERTILDAYRWLSDNYQEGDRIFLFGFSRGATQVRVLSAMIDKVGLIHQGNERQIPFAYALYKGHKSGRVGLFLSKAERFKRAFSHDRADVHYVGVWDTVSSIGIIRGKHMLPGTADGMKHVCYFRHALALDERRVRFTPEYAYGGSATSPPGSNPALPDELTQTEQNPKHDKALQTLEVWFAGTHSDIGGGNVSNETMDRSRPPLRWMVFESAAAGLRTKPFHRVLLSSEQIEVKESLSGSWWILEYLPLSRFTYTRRMGGKPTTHKPHMGKGRKIHHGQKIHGSVTSVDPGQDQYTPKALLPNDDPNFWNNYLVNGLGNWKAFGLFEATQDTVNTFIDRQDDVVWELLGRIVRTVHGRQAVYEATLAALRNLHTTPNVTLSTKVKFISNITRILDRSERKDTPLMKFDMEDVRALFSDFRESDDDGYIAICNTFLRRFTRQKSYVEARVGQEWPIPSVAVFPDGSQIVAASLDRTIRSWDAEKGGLQKEYFHRPADVINVIVVSPNGKLIVTGLEDGTINLWNAEADKPVARLLEGHTASVRSLGFSPGGKLVASGSEDNTVRLWDVENGTQIGAPLVGNESPICAVGFGGGGRRIVSCSTDRIVCVWNVETRQPVRDPLNLRLERSQEWIFPTAISPNGTLVAAGFLDETIRIWDLDTGKIVGKPFRHHRAVIGAVAFSPDGRKIVSGSSDGTVLVWDVDGQKVQLNFQEGVWVRSVAFFPDGNRVVIGCDDGTIRIRDAEPWDRLRVGSYSSTEPQ